MKFTTRPYTKILTWRIEFMVLLFIIYISACKKQGTPPGPVVHNNWKSISLNYGNANQVLFLSTDTGFILGAAQYIAGTQTYHTVLLRTTDRGEHWKQDIININNVSILSINNFQHTLFISGIQFDRQNNNNITKNYISTDAGITWKEIKSNLPLGTNTFSLQTGMLGSLTYQGGIYITTDGGNSFSQVYNDISAIGSFKRLFFTDQMTGYASGGYAADGTSAGKLAKTTDGGLTWSNVYRDFKSIQDISFVNAKTGYLMIYDQKGNIAQITSQSEIIYKTIDGAQALTPIGKELISNYELFLKCFFFNEKTGFGLGAKTIYATSDGGLTWSKDSGEDAGGAGNTSIHGLYFRNQTEGYALTENGFLLKKTN